MQLLAGAVAAAGVLSLGVGASEARPAEGSGQVTISMFAVSAQEPQLSVLIPNFERVYPNISLNVTYTSVSGQLELTELGAGNAPDLLTTFPGCGSATSVCELAKAGNLAPLIKAPWVKWSLPLVTSLSKHGQALYAFEPVVEPFGMFTNDSLFSKLGLKVPQTFSQLLAVCQKAQADGTTAVLIPGTGLSISWLLEDLAVATVYGQDKQWATELKAGTVSFDGTPGWREALQEFIDMNNAGCFEPGMPGITSGGTLLTQEFAQGQGLMAPGISVKGSIDAANPQFTYSFHPFPAGSAADQTSTFLNLGPSLSVNAHSSAQNQAAAQTFIDFIARPKQNALWAQINGGLTQYEFLKQQIPSFMSPLAAVVREHEYVLNPQQTWWNANVYLALVTDGIGLITGQSTIDGILNAMDAAWKQGPS